jgi:D-alanyl-D-alanine carboxypeptidase (penicillin-binding protein 5/6)
MVSNARRLVACLSLLILASAVLGFSRPAAAQLPYASLFFSQPRYAAIVIDANSGEVLYERNADSPRYPASITKLMTLYLSFEALQAGKISLSDRVMISPHAAAQAPSKLGLRPGDSITVDEAIRAMTVKSANDIAVAMAEKLGGSEGKFAALMTLRAQELGMRNTQYVNASGLPDTRQLSTARDIAVLSRALMRDFPQYYPYFSLRGFSFRGRYVPGHDHLLGSVQGVDGLKTGYTTASGFNLASSAVRDGRRLIGVVLGGSSVAARDQHMEDLLNTSFSVIRKRALGEHVTVAQNLFEPAPTGPVTRPATEQGDGDQNGLKIVLNDDPAAALMRRVSTPEEAPPAETSRGEMSPAVEHCRSVRTVHVVRGRHGRRTRVAQVSRQCEGARLSAVDEVRPCAARHGRHHHADCEAAREPRAHGRHHGRASRVADEGRRPSHRHRRRARA